MSRRKVIGLLAIGALAISVSAFGIRVFSQAGQFTTIKQLGSDKCQIYSGILAPEDIAMDRENRVAFISSYDRKRGMSKKPGSQDIRGSIQMLDLADFKPGVAIKFSDVTPAMPKRFRPLGISLFKGEDNTRRLFVVNQVSAGKHTVEIFRIEANKLVHEKSVDLGTDVIFANDVLAVGPDRFYVTDSAGMGKTSEYINFALQRQRSKVFYFDGKKIQQAASGFVMANGIALSKNGEQVYVVDTFARTLRFFKRDSETGGLEDEGVLFIGTGLDNIDVAADGSLWMAAHPRLIDFALYKLGRKAVSASQVIRAVPGKETGGEVRTVYLDLGEQLSGSSVAVAFGKNYMIGSALENKLAICSL